MDEEGRGEQGAAVRAAVSDGSSCAWGAAVLWHSAGTGLPVSPSESGNTNLLLSCSLPGPELCIIDTGISIFGETHLPYGRERADFRQQEDDIATGGGRGTSKHQVPSLCCMFWPAQLMHHLLSSQREIAIWPGLLFLC